MLAGPFKCKYALVCEDVPESFATQAIRSDSSASIDLERAREQQRDYIDLLRGLVDHLITIPASEQYPDCVFVEDIAIILNDIALICRPGAESRRGEVDAVRNALSRLKIQTIDVSSPAIIDGGDVLFTGKEIFVGLSGRTNVEGAQAVARAFPDYPVATVKVDDGLHLKSLVTMADTETLVVVGSEAGKKVIDEMQSNCNYVYQKITVPVGGACNCLHVNGNIIHRSKAEIEEVEKFFEVMKIPTHQVDNSEFAKADGCLTCRSILF